MPAVIPFDQPLPVPMGALGGAPMAQQGAAPMAQQGSYPSYPQAAAPMAQQGSSFSQGGKPPGGAIPYPHPGLGISLGVGRTPFTNSG